MQIRGLSYAWQGLFAQCQGCLKVTIDDSTAEIDAAVPLASWEGGKGGGEGGGGGGGGHGPVAFSCRVTSVQAI